MISKFKFHFSTLKESERKNIRTHWRRREGENEVKTVQFAWIYFQLLAPSSEQLAATDINKDQ